MLDKLDILLELHIFEVKEYLLPAQIMKETRKMMVTGILPSPED